jgi:hypothetical protein
MNGSQRKEIIMQVLRVITPQKSPYKLYKMYRMMKKMPMFPLFPILPVSLLLTSTLFAGMAYFKARKISKRMDLLDGRSLEKKPVPSSSY